MIRAELIGKEHLVPFIHSILPRVQKQLEESITRLCIQLSRSVKENKLSGAVLRNRTGRLRRSINYRLETTPTSVYGIVGTNVEYARAHEYGVDKNVTVREHMRQIKKAWGKDLKAPKAVMVRSHSRHMRLPERSFLRSALREMDAEIKTQIAAALK